MIEICKGTNLSVFLQRIKQKEEMENKKPIVLNNLEEWDFTDYIVGKIPLFQIVEYDRFLIFHFFFLLYSLQKYG